MKKTLFLLTLLAIISISAVCAQTRSGTSSGTLENITVEASAKTTVIYADHGETPGSFQAYPFDGDWSFTWSGSGVNFTGVLNFGDYRTITDAGSMGGVTIQTFFGFAHNVRGTGQWNAATRTMTYEMRPEGRDDSRASRATWTREATCEKVSGMFAGKACSAFMESSPGLEGLKISFRFSEDLSSFEGEAVLIQFGGKGVTESETTIVTRIRGSLR